jgi:hypothetical protein
MNSPNQLELLTTSSSMMMKRSIRGFPNIEVETHYPILVNMFNEQTEHLYCKFNDGYLKVCSLFIIYFHNLSSDCTLSFFEYL